MMSPEKQQCSSPISLSGSSVSTIDKPPNPIPSPLMRRKLMDPKHLDNQVAESIGSKMKQEPLGLSLDGEQPLRQQTTLSEEHKTKQSTKSSLKVSSLRKKQQLTTKQRDKNFRHRNLSQTSELRECKDNESLLGDSIDLAGIGGGVPTAADLVGELPPKSCWPHNPILIRWASSAGAVTLSSDNAPINPLEPLLVNSSPIHFETALFAGEVLIRVRNVPDLPSDSLCTHEYFKNRMRTLQICIQGQFKKRLCLNQVYSGQEFSRPLKKVPARRLVKWAFSLLRSRLPDSFTADLFSPLPYYMAPLILAAKAVRADLADAPDITDHDILEDLRYHGVQPISTNDITALNQEASCGNWRAKQRTVSKLKKAKQRAALNAIKRRKKDIGAPLALARHFYEPGVTYTFDYYDSFFRPDSFCLDLGIKQLELCPIIGEQPVVLSMAKTIDTGEYLWKFEMWHERGLSSSSDMFKNS